MPNRSKPCESKLSKIDGHAICRPQELNGNINELICEGGEFSFIQK